MGANSFRKRVFQGPLTLGLHSTTFRSALPSATLPYPRQFFHRANRALVFFRFLLFPSVMTDVCFSRVLSQVFTCSGTRANSFTALNRALVFFYSLLFSSVMTDVRFTWVLSQVFTCSGTRANSITALNRALVFFRFLLFPSVRTDVCFPRVLSQVFTCSGTRAGSITAQTAHLFFSLSSVPVGYNRRLLFAGALTGFHLFGYPRKFHHRAKPPTNRYKL